MATLAISAAAFLVVVLIHGAYRAGLDVGADRERQRYFQLETRMDIVRCSHKIHPVAAQMRLSQVELLRAPEPKKLIEDLRYRLLNHIIHTVPDDAIAWNRRIDPTLEAEIWTARMHVLLPFDERIDPAHPSERWYRNAVRS